MSEFKYISLLQKVLATGTVRNNARNMKTKSVFGERLVFNAEKELFPLLTTKKMYWNGIVSELNWFMKGGIDARILQKQNVHIWDGNTSREYLDSRGLQKYEVGECGPIYGFQWRRSGAKYSGIYHNYENEGIDQLQTCVDLIKKDPESRRIIMSAWNPIQLPEMCLPPCHILYQWYVNTQKGTLDCQMYQRSADLFLGLPFNIASTALLNCIIAEITGLKSNTISIVIGDAHIYENQFKAVEEQIGRPPMKYPRLKFKNKIAGIDTWSKDDIEILEYLSHPAIKVPMVS